MEISSRYWENGFGGRSELELRELPKRMQRLRMGLANLIGTDWGILEGTNSHIY